MTVDADAIEEVARWAERNGLVRLAALLRRNTAALAPLAAEIAARIPDAESALNDRQAALWSKRAGGGR